MQRSRSRGTTLLPPRRGRGTLVQLGRSWGTLVRPLRTRLRWRGRGREPGRGAQGVDEQGPQRAVERGAGEVRARARARAARRDDRAHEVDVGRGGPVEHRVGHRAEPDAAAVGLQRQRWRSAGRAGRAASAVAVGACSTSSPRRAPSSSGNAQVTDQSRRSRCSTAWPSATASTRRAAHHAATAAARSRRRPVPLRAPHDRARRRRSRRGRAARAAGRTRRHGPGRAARRRRRPARSGSRTSVSNPSGGVLVGRPDQPQHRRLVAAGQLGGRAGQLGDRRRRPVRGERHRTRRAHHPRRGRSGEHGGEPDAEPTDRARVVPLGRRAQRRERRHPRRVSGAPVFATRSSARPAATAPPVCPASAPTAHAAGSRSAAGMPIVGVRFAAVARPRLGLRQPRCAHRRRSRARGVGVGESDPQPSRTPRGVGGVLGQLDQPRVGVTAEAQVLLGVGVLAEPGGRGRPGGEDRRAQRGGAEGVGPPTP